MLKKITGLKVRHILNFVKNIVLLILLTICLNLSLQAQTTAFTYQGKLTDGNSAANGQYDLTFRLYDSVAGGTQIGSIILTDDVMVATGIFTVNLNFGAAPFISETARFLEISVRAGASTGAYTTLLPRQPITSSPFSIRTLSATSADGLSSVCNPCVTDGQIVAIDGVKVTGAVNNAVTAATATNVSGIVQILNGGTGSATKNFTDLTSDQNISGRKTFLDPISGNGSGLTNVPGTLKWNVISANQQAVANNGYLIDGSGNVRINLPAAPQVDEIIRIACAGNGGFTITQNVGQFITFNNADQPNILWIPRDQVRQWFSVASSADGTKLVAAAKTTLNDGLLFTSTDSGVTWTPRESLRDWFAVASSADGNKLVAVVTNGQIYTSTDSGVNWMPRESSRAWFSVASSADGTKLVAAPQTGQIFTSTDSGANWIPRDQSRRWRSFASSADGTKLVAAVGNGQIYTSADSGVNWIPRESVRFWTAVASSSDGSKLAAVVNPGQIYTSTDSGVNWMPRESNREWSAIASSADGVKLVAAVANGQIYTSADSGATWFPQESARNWSSVASSADGLRLVAVVSGGQAYTRGAFSSSGLSGGITGGNSSSLEIIYLGAGRFSVMNPKGNLVAY